MEESKLLSIDGGVPKKKASATEYEGGGWGRRLSTWGTSTSGSNTTIVNNLTKLRSRSRELIRNNPLIDGGTGSYIANLIGSGITPRWQLEDKELKKDIQQLWADWTLQADLYGVVDFYGLQSLIARGLIDAGEMLSRFIYLDKSPLYAVPLQLQLLEADHLDHQYNTILNGNQVRMGIEINGLGQRVAYHLFKEHPGELYLTQSFNIDRIPVPAKEITHVFRPLRAGQMRGRPWLSSIIAKMHELDQYEDAELVRKKTAAMFGGFITEGAGVTNAEAFFGKKKDRDYDDRDVIALEPGTFPILPQGLDVKFSQPTDVGSTYEVWIKQQLREIAVGMGVTYEQLTNDLSGVNYSSIRAGLLEFRRRCQQVQYEIIIFQFCRRVAEEFMDMAVLSGAIKIPDYFQNRRNYLRIKWRPDGWDWVDPEKDQRSAKMAIRSGFKSRAQVVAERPGGRDVEDVDNEISEDNDRADSLGLVFDTDPRETDNDGSLQVDNEGNTVDKTKEGE